MIKPKKFVGLHAHDGFSTFDGMGLPQAHFDFVLKNTKEEQHTPALAITNHGHMNSYAHAYLYSKELKKQGTDFKFIPGCEIYMHPSIDEWKRDYELDKDAKAAAKKEGKKIEKEEVETVIENEEETKSGKHFNPLKRRHHLVVLAKHSKGLQHLFHTVSRGFLEGYFYYPRVDLKMLKDYKGSFIVSTACIGGPLAYDIFSHFQNEEFEGLKASLVDDPIMLEKVLMSMENTVDKIVDSVGKENFFLELQFNKLNAQHLVNRCLIELHKRTGISLIATADSHYYSPEVWKEREIYKKLGWLNYRDYDPSHLPQSINDLKAELYPKNATQMWEEYKNTGAEYNFYDDQLVCDAIERTHDIAFDVIGDVTPDVSVKLPSYVVPKEKTADEALREACYEGLKVLKLAHKQKYTERLDFELSVITERDFSKYFLTMKAIVDIAGNHMLIGCGRGSGAGSLVNYSLGITQVDPIKYDLLFERFISKYREEMPDIDTDVSDRDLLVDLLKEKFGDVNVIPISNINTFQLKSLVKDTSRFFGIPYEEVNESVKTLDEDVRKAVLKQGQDKNLFQLKYEDGLSFCEPFRNFIEQHPYVGEPIKVLYKENKSLGKHAGGVIISENIPENMPVILSKKKPQTPWVEGMHYKHLEHLGFIKFDLLGLETLRIIERCIELILQRHANDKLSIELDNGEIFEAYTFQKIRLSDGSWKLIDTLCDDDDIQTPVRIR